MGDVEVSEAIPLQTTGLGRRFRSGWALRDCTLSIPKGRIVGLVGENGAGKTTLLRLAVGLLAPTAGEIHVFGVRPQDQQQRVLSRISYVAQDRPLYKDFMVDELMRLGRELNHNWDQNLVDLRLRRLAIDPKRRIRHLSGGQAAQVALCLALGKEADLMLLDEPVSNLDPRGRRDFFNELGNVVASNGQTVVISSHIVADLERTCDYLIVLADGAIRLSGDIATLLSAHRRLTVPRREPEERLKEKVTVIHADHLANSSVLVVKVKAVLPFEEWEVDRLSLDDLVIAYMGSEQTVSDA